MAFDVATYTDVDAREAIDGVDGFNFQSVSPGVTGVDRQRIRERLLHRVLPTWALDHDPLAHPATCAYLVQGGRFYLSRGKSTGDTNSGRPGNQVTQAIVTSDPDDFVPYRPAQLYGAAEWTLAKAPSSSAQPWITPLEIRPEFEVAALEALVSSDEWAASVLPQYITMVDAAIAAEPKKLVLVHTDLDVVMQWIALGTLFLDADAARDLQFRALVEDPWRVDAQIVGISPDFGRDGLGSAHVLDLELRQLPDIEATDSARVRASWFVEQGADDALNAIDIARRWEPTLGAALANDAAWVVALPDVEKSGRSAWQAAMATTEGLAAAGLRDELAMYGEELCEATFGYGPASTEEFGLAGRAIRRAHDLEIDEVASGMLVPTLEALAAAPTASEAFAHALSGSASPIRWESAEAQAAAGAFLGDLLNSAPVGALPELFATANVVAAPVAEPLLIPAIQRLAGAWVREPALGRASWQRWLAGHAVLSATAQGLVTSWRSGDETSLADLLRGAWDFIGPQTDHIELHGWLKALEFARIPADDRDNYVARTTRVPAEAWRVALAGSRVPKHARLWASWINYHGLPTDMAGTLKVTIADALRADPRASGGVKGGDWHSLMESLGRSTDLELAAFAGDYSRARTTFSRTRATVATRPAARLDACLPYLGRLTPLLLPDIGWLLLNSSKADEIEKLWQASSPWGPRAIHACILDLAAKQDPLRALDHALRLRHDPDQEVAAGAAAALAEILGARPELVEIAKDQPWLRNEMDKYLREQSRGHEGKRRLGGAFGRNREK
ncbi:MAG: hypothetical protein ACOYEV_07405 [Candidatus Nanopelagicales bacterium]